MSSKCLKLTRRPGESIVLVVPGSAPIEIEVVRCRRGSVVAAFRASPNVAIVRRELLDEMRGKSGRQP